jgi:flagellar protein FlaF
MTSHAYAHSGYASAVKPTRTGRGMEYALFAKITHRMTAVDETNRSDFPALAQAVFDNQHLWSLLAADLMHDGNALPVPLRAQLIGIAEFVRKHSLRVLGGKASASPLIEINTAIMRGLRGPAEAMP